MNQIAMHKYIYTEIDLDSWSKYQEGKDECDMTGEGQFIWGPWRSSLSKSSEQCSAGGGEVLFGVELWRRQNTVLIFLFSLGRYSFSETVHSSASSLWSVQIFKSPWTSSHLCPHSFLLWSHQSHQATVLKFHLHVLFISPDLSSITQTSSSPTAYLISQHRCLINIPIYVSAISF